MAYKGPFEAIGEASSTDDTIARFDGTDGFRLQDSSVTLNDAGDIIPVGDRTQDLGSTTLAFDNIYADGLSFDDGSNFLNFYEEGTWTPDISFGGGSTGITYSSQRGQYTRIGNVCLITFIIILTNKGSSTGTVAVNNLPFTADNSVIINPPNHVILGSVTFSGYCSFRILNNTTRANISDITSGSSLANLTDTAFANNSGIQGSALYFVQT